MPAQAFPAEDLNREFTENFFRLGAADMDARLRVAKSEARADEGLEPVNGREGAEASEGNDPSWVGKFLQLAIIFLLGVIVYLLSRKKRGRGRY